MSSTRKKQRVVGTIENASILRKFTILFLLMSVIPLTILYYIYVQIREYGEVQIKEADFNLTLIFVVCGVLVGYFAMRAVLRQLIELSIKNTQTLQNFIGKREIDEINSEKNEITVLAKSFTQITERLEENVEKLEVTKRTLQSVMSKIGQGISKMQNIDTFLELILETVTEALSGNIGVLLMTDNEKQELVVKAVHGTYFNAIQPIRIQTDRQMVFSSALKSREPLLIPKVTDWITKSREYDHLFEAPLLCSPLIIHEKVCGIITVSCKDKNVRFEDDDKTLLLNIASQTAVAMENSRLSENIEKTYFETISALAMAVEAKDRYSRGHQERVAKYCVQIGRKLGLEDEDIEILRAAAKLHDLGKIGIPDEVLTKPGPLTDEEWEMMRKHPEIGESIVKPITSLNHLCDIIRHHHEKLDGTGYPDKLKGTEITPLVRIATVADIYDALTTDRSYRAKHSPKEACSILEDMAGQLDQDIVQAFIESLEENHQL